MDGRGATRDSARMITQPYRLYIERKDATKNMARFYSLEIGSNLFGEVYLTRRWGRIGARGQTAAHQFSREEDAVGLFLDLARRKLRRGYRPRTRARPEKQTT
ncbi:WGR domain-containing protein [Ensifer adhaerens]|uniref:WGR domain-containing protein n=1 Tax=Ensifer adhaerens TaxID=106592 RepID=UPI001F1A4E53|nr:WGR domain-containing protein [Ensifer adhaerens]